LELSLEKGTSLRGGRKVVPGLGLHQAPLRTLALRLGHPGAGICLVCGFAQLHVSLTPGVGGCGDGMPPP